MHSLKSLQRGLQDTTYTKLSKIQRLEHMFTALNLHSACLRRWRNCVLSSRKDWGHITPHQLAHKGCAQGAPGLSSIKGTGMCPKLTENKLIFVIYSVEMAGATVQTVTCSEREFRVLQPWLSNQFSICFNIFLSHTQLTTEGITATELISMKTTQKYSVPAVVLWLAFTDSADYRRQHGRSVSLKIRL